MWVKDFGQGILFSSLGTDNAITTPTVYVTTNNKIAYYYNHNRFSWSYKIMNVTMDNYQASGWHHIAITSSCSLGIVNLYIDGRLIDTFGEKQASCKGIKMQIGGNGDVEAVTDPMTVDNVRVYKRSINPVEVAAIYNAERK